MGFGGKKLSSSSTPRAQNGSDATATPGGLPEKLPTMGELRRAIPPYCFQPRVLKSLSYCVRSFALWAALTWLYTAATLADTPFLLRAVVSLVYWNLLGVVMWGVFTLGHDCGHSSFSKHPVLNWVCGVVLHTSILVPYESWRLSHRHHHANTGHIDNDEIFYPMRKTEQRYSVRFATWTLGLAWQVYLLVGFGPRYVYHFNPKDPLFQYYKAATKVLLSVVAYLAWLAGLAYLVHTYGLWTVCDLYFIPLMVFGSWLTVTTFLHHNEPNVPWYSGEEWTFVRGALSSVDRDYFPFNSIIHNIGTHQVHHLFAEIPHYYLNDATKAFRAAFPELVRASKTPILMAFVRNLAAYVRHGAVDDDVTMYTYSDGRGVVLKKQTKNE